MEKHQVDSAKITDFNCPLRGYFGASSHPMADPSDKETWQDFAGHIAVMRQLVHFVTVAELESIKEAAKKLSISASPLSHSISQSEEDEIGVPLFDHAGGGKQLNETGKALLREVRAILQAYADARHRARTVSPTAPTKLHVGYSGSPTAEFLDHAITAFERAFRPIHVVRHPISASHYVDELLRRKLELVFGVEPLRMPDPRLRFEKITSYPIRCVVGESHPLGSHSFVHIDDLRGHKLLIFSRMKWKQYHDYIRRWSRDWGFEPDISDDYDEFETLIPAVEGGHGVALLMSSARAPERKVRFLPIRPELPEANVGAVFVPPLSKTLATLIEFAKAAAASAKGETAPRDALQRERLGGAGKKKPSRRSFVKTANTPQGVRRGRNEQRRG